MDTKPLNTKEIIAYLAEKFPACFSVAGQAKPLKVGIFQDLAEQLAEDEKVSKTRLRQALRHYTSSWRYLKSVKLGSKRVDLQGAEVAEIDQQQADFAAQTLKESQEKFANKKADDKPAKKAYNKTNAQANGDKASGKNKPAASKHDKFKQVNSKARSAKTVKAKNQAKLKPIEATNVLVGSEVKVQVANSPMNAVVTEISGDDVSVQLTSGMIVKTQIKHLFTE